MFWCALKKFILLWRSIMHNLTCGLSHNTLIFPNFLKWFQSTRSWMKAHHFTFLYSETNINFSLKIYEVFSKKIFHITFLEYFFYEHICSILTNQVSNKRLWYPVYMTYHFSMKKIVESFGGVESMLKMFKMLGI